MTSTGASRPPAPWGGAGVPGRSKWGTRRPATPNAATRTGGSGPRRGAQPLPGGQSGSTPGDEQTSPAHVASCYEGLIDALVIDEADADDLDDLPVRPIVTKTLMTDAHARRRLAEAAITIAA